MPEREPKTMHFSMLVDKPGKAAELIIYDRITPDPWTDAEVSAAGVLNDLAGLESGRPLDVRINSGGGSVTEGIAIRHAISRHDGPVNIYIEGIAASIATVVATAGDLVAIAEGSLYMVHNPWTPWAAGAADDLRKHAEVLDKMTDQLIGFYVDKTGKSEQEIRELMDAETWMTASEALDAGFVDAIVPAKKAAAQATYDLSRFGRVPDSLVGQKTKQPPKQTQSPPRERKNAMSAASAKDIKAACVGCDAQFVLDQIEAEASIQEAQAAHITTMAAKVENRDEQIAALKTEHAELVDALKVSMNGMIEAKDAEIAQLKTDIQNVKLGATDEDGVGTQDASTGERKSLLARSGFKRS